MENKFDKNVYNTVNYFLQYIDMLLGKDACYAITDREKFLCIKQGKEFKLPYEENQPINESIRNVINT